MTTLALLKKKLNICDPTWVIEADVVHWPKLDFADNVLIIVVSFFIPELREINIAFLRCQKLRSLSCKPLNI